MLLLYQIYRCIVDSNRYISKIAKLKYYKIATSLAMETRCKDLEELSMSRIAMFSFIIAHLSIILVLMEERYILAVQALKIETLHSLILLLTIIVQ